MVKVNLSYTTPMEVRGGGGRMYSSYSFTTLALGGGDWSVSHPSHALPAGKGPLVPVGQEAA
jgi:hypothetical protein